MHDLWLIKIAGLDGISTSLLACFSPSLDPTSGPSLGTTLLTGMYIPISNWPYLSYLLFMTTCHCASSSSTIVQSFYTRHKDSSPLQTPLRSSSQPIPSTLPAIQLPHFESANPSTIRFWQNYPLKFDLLQQYYSLAVAILSTSAYLRQWLEEADERMARNVVDNGQRF
jgi:hypothetical protein